MGKPSAPTPPSPTTTAQAQTSTNVQTAVANAYLDNVNQVTPQGSLTYNQTGNYGWTDPTTGATYQVPTFTATQTLTPEGQAIQAQQLGTQYNLAGMANAQSGAIANLLSQPMNLSGAPAAGSASGLASLPQAATTYDTGGQIATGIGPVGAITQSYGPDNFSQDRQSVQDALMARMNPQLQIEENNLQQQLANQGIRYGSQAYQNAMLNYQQQANDARWGAISQASQEQVNEVGMAAQQAAFQNAAQQQGYQQQLGTATFQNQAQLQQYNQNAALAQFYNQGLAQQVAQQQDVFNASDAARNQYLQEQYAQRNQPINEVTSLLSGSQVQQPNFVNTPGSQVATTDVAGLINNNFNQQMGIYQQQNANYNSLLGGILGLGAGAIKASDRNVKKDIVHMGTVFSANDDDEAEPLPIYEYSYKGDPASVRHIGPMAQDVEKQDPGAVRTIGGTKYIDQRRVMGNILRAA